MSKSSQINNVSQNGFGEFAEIYDNQMGADGDYCHQNLVDPALIQCCKGFQNKVVYDIGCGNGYLDQKFIQFGASRVVASDVSKDLIEIASQKISNSKISFLHREGLDISGLSANQFDLIVLNMSIHYIGPLEDLAKNLTYLLKPNGRIAFTTSHLLHLKDLHRPLHSLFFPYKTIDKIKQNFEKYLNNYSELIKWRTFNKTNLKIYRRPISKYINTFTDLGLVLDTFIETPTAYPTKKGHIYSSNIPMFMAFGFRKPS